MDKKTFIEKLADVLQTEDELNFETVLDNLDEWDSLSKMAVIAFLDKEFKTKITFSDIKDFKTVEDIAKKAGL